ncbi:NAD-dependent epimerase/dehydratase family protein [Nannocystaceae bacterium ST9]
MSRILITGASGFIGSHLAEVLRERGHEVRAMVRKSSRLDKLEQAAEGRPFELVYAALDDFESLLAALRDVDVVHHVAGTTAAFDRANFDRANVEGVANLLLAIRTLHERGEPAPTRLVHVSSLMAAGPSHPDQARREHHRHVEGFTLYGDSKLAGEKLIWAEAGRRSPGELDLLIVRPPLVYGPRDEDVLQMIKSAAMRVVAQPGLRPTWMSAIHGRDLARGIALVGERGLALPGLGDPRRADHVLADGGLALDELAVHDHPSGAGIYYLTDGGRTTVAEFGQITARLLGRKALTLPMPSFAVVGAGWVNQGIGRLRGKVPALTLDKARASLSPGWWCEDERARTEIDWQPEFPLERGLDDTLRWLVDNGQIRANFASK